MADAQVIIVGGGPAGISTALFLAHSAPELTDRIVVLEKANYPREKPCAGGIGARADRLLGTIGVQVDVPSVWLKGVGFRACGQEVIVRDEDRPGPIGRVVRRIEYDHELARQAMKRGIRVVQGAGVTGISRSESGFEVESRAGVFRGRVLVGADGVGSVVRKHLGFTATRYLAQAIEVDTAQVDSDAARDVIVFDAHRRSLPGYYWDFPTVVDGRELMCRGVYLLKKNGEPDPGIQIKDILGEELRSRGLDLESCRTKRFAERGFSPHQPLSVPGVLLVGEAAGIDPVLGEGIAQAVCYGRTAARYLAERLRAEDLGFEDWYRRVMSEHVGRDLRLREIALGLFYGPRRPTIERFLIENPEFVRVGVRHFAGTRWGAGSVLRAGWAAGAHTARALLTPEAELEAPAGQTT